MSQDLVTELINALTILPGVGKKSAQRMALYLLDRNKDGASILANTLNKAVENIQRCSTCRMLTSRPICNICSDSSRDSKILKLPISYFFALPSFFLGPLLSIYYRHL